MRVLLCIALLFLSSLSNVQADKPTQVFPLEYYLTQSDYLNVELSPDGKHYAARVRDNGSVYLLIYNSSSKELVGAARPGTGNEIKGMKWVANDRLVYDYGYLNRRLDSKGSFGELYSVSLDGSINHSVAGMKTSTMQYHDESRSWGENHLRKAERMATYKLIDPLLDDQDYALAVAYPWDTTRNILVDNREQDPIIMKVGLWRDWKNRTKRVESIPLKNGVPVVGPNGNINFVYKRDSNWNIQTYYRENPKSPWVMASEQFGNAFEHAYPVAISADGGKVFLYGPREEDSVLTIFEFNLQTKSIRPMFDNVVSIIEWSLDSNNEPYMAFSYPDKHSYHYDELKTGKVDIKIHKQFAKSFNESEVRVLQGGNASSKRVIHVSSSNNPGEYYLYDIDTRKADFIQANYSWMDPNDLVSKQPIKFRARDNQELHGYLTLPAKASDKPLPVIVLVHGGPHGVRDLPSYDARIQLLASRGYAVLQVNFRGSSGYSNDFERAGYKQWAGTMLDDISDSHSFIESDDRLDAERVCLYGASYGAFAAVSVAAKNPGQYRCIVAASGVYDLPLLFDVEYSDIPETEDGRNYLKLVVGDDFELLKQQSPISFAKNIKEPLLLIHGMQDQRISETQSLRFKEALEEENLKPTWIGIGSAGHKAESLRNRKKAFEAILGFIEDHLKT